MKPGRAHDVDVVVVGGGPGGSTVATLVAKQGHRVVLLEKETFPRYQIGESLLPATVHGICGLLGISDKLANAGFMPKGGGTFRWGTNPEPWTFFFGNSPLLSGLTAPAYQVERSKFDAILLDNARDSGVDVRENCLVTEVIDDEDRVRGLRYTDTDGAHEVLARFVIDASGNKSRLHSAVGGTRRYSEFFKNLALFGYFEGGKRLPAPNSGNILCEAFESGWFWYIPLTDQLTSVGAVVKSEMAEKVQGDPERALNRLIAESTLVRDYLAGAHRVTSGQYGQLRVRKDYSYRNSTFWRPGMALIGDAACFVDPVFSSGVHLATYSALLAARSINSVLAGVVDETRAFQEFQARYQREFGLYYEFLMAFYDMNKDEQSYFWQARTVTNSQLSEMDAFIELVGGVSSHESALVRGGKPPTSARYSTVTDELATVMDDASQIRETGWFLQELHGEQGRLLLGAGSDVRDRADLNHGFDAAETLFPDGLAVAEDGVHWAVPLSR